MVLSEITSTMKYGSLQTAPYCPTIVISELDFRLEPILRADQVLALESCKVLRIYYRVVFFP